MPPDFTRDGLLDLNGEIIVLDDGCWVKFEVRKVAVSTVRPHGLKYSLTLHDPQNERIVGYDNSHAVEKKGWSTGYDHCHFDKTVKPYAYRDAISLLEDFWADVDRMRARRSRLV